MRASRACCSGCAAPTRSDAPACCDADSTPTHAGSTSAAYSRCSPSTRASLRRRRAARRRRRRRRRWPRPVSTRGCSRPPPCRSRSSRAGACTPPPVPACLGAQCRPPAAGCAAACCSALARARARPSAPSAPSVSAPYSLGGGAGACPLHPLHPALCTLRRRVPALPQQRREYVAAWWRKALERQAHEAAQCSRPSRANPDPAALGSAPQHARHNHRLLRKPARPRRAAAPPPSPLPPLAPRRCGPRRSRAEERLGRRAAAGPQSTTHCTPPSQGRRSRRF